MKGFEDPLQGPRRHQLLHAREFCNEERMLRPNPPLQVRTTRFRKIPGSTRGCQSSTNLGPAPLDERQASAIYAGEFPIVSSTRDEWRLEHRLRGPLDLRQASGYC